MFNIVDNYAKMHNAFFLMLVKMHLVGSFLVTVMHVMHIASTFGIGILPLRLKH